MPFVVLVVWSQARLIYLSFKKHMVMVVMVEMMVPVKVMPSQAMLTLTQFQKTQVGFYILSYLYFFYSNFSLNYRYCTENGAASASRQGKKLVISEEYFQRVTQALVMRLRQHEEAVMRDGKLQDPFHSCFMIFMFLS